MYGLGHPISNAGMMKGALSWLRVVFVGLFVICAVTSARVDAAPGPDVRARRADSVDFSAVAPAVTTWETYSGYVLASTVFIGLLMFVGWTAYRRYHETEVRALSGGYIADGVEAAWLKFPELLKTGADVRATKALATLASFSEPEDEEFYRWADRNIKGMRTVLAALGTALEPSARQPVLADIAATLEAFKSKTSKAELRPAWQLAFVIELLVNRLRERPAEVTLSTTRTIASALDVLTAASRPGVRPDLIVEPPLAVLAVDDDPLCLRAISFALQKAGLAPETAVDGTGAVEKCREKNYDVVFMDIMMPGMDGLEACRQLRNNPGNANTPVVFVTARSDFQTRERSAEVGGAELIAKPFLVTELTVKAVSFCMRKRLNLPMTSSSGVADSLVVGAQPVVPHATPATDPNNGIVKQVPVPGLTAEKV
jgi:CheY-like chemotaxis protein